jgi:hypothetical protein
MRTLVLAMLVLITTSPSSQAVVRAPAQNECADRNALQNIAYDARLTAIQFYYQGFIQNLGDKSRRICYEAHVLMDDRFIVLNNTRELVEKNCLPIDVAARIAVQGLCP